MTGQIQKQYYEEYWDRGLSDWSPAGVTISAFEQQLLTRFIPRNSRVLDFGCGDGSHAGPFLLSNDCSYVGADISATAVAMCRDKGLDATEYTAEAPLPFEDERFDSVVSFEVFEHLFSPHQALMEIHRVLRPGGCLVGSVPNSVHVGNRLLMAAGHFSPGGSPATSLRAPWRDPHIRFFSKQTLLSFLNDAGFKQCAVTGREFSFVDLPVLYRSVRATRRLLAACSRPLAPLGRWWPSFCSATLYFVAQK
jgi:2-polyprenyl-6-hydroxyphenyl methylase/3-demethylubiquinone-9 3-methyltransferase